MAPNDGYHPDDSGITPDWATRDGAHRYVGIIMVIVMVLLAVCLWATFAGWPRRLIRRWLGRGEKGCGEEGCNHEACGDEESQNKALRGFNLQPNLLLRGKTVGGAEAMRGRSRRREEGKAKMLEVGQIEHLHSSSTTMANTAFRQEKHASTASMGTSQTVSTAQSTEGTQPAPLPALPPPAYTLCRTRIRTPFVGSQPEPDSGRTSRLSWHWLKRVGTPNSRS